MYELIEKSPDKLLFTSENKKINFEYNLHMNSLIFFKK